MPFATNIQGVIRLAAASRAFYIGISYVAYLLLPRFDKSTELIPSNSCMKFLLSWDSIHFLEIMERGYRKTHEAAFFPLLPYLSRCIHKVLPLDPYTVGVLVSCTAFVFSSALLYRITQKRYGNKIAAMSCILFIFNPASIVYTAMYSESLFMLLFLLGMYFIENRDTVRGVLFLSLCGLCRSNAVLFAPFLMCPLSRYTFTKIAVFLLPLAAFQYYTLLMINRANNTYKIFIPYSFIQRTLWEQGLFRFFTYKNIPNVLVGLPFILISLFILREYWNKRCAGSSKAIGILQHFNTDMCAVVLLAQTLITVFLIHWNMYFRFVSFNPLIYWILAEKYYTMNNGLWKKVLFRFYFGFGIAYAILFGCFYPPC
ncbi:putative integral membrane protein [Encephalitozoon intestinalis ATCC 50506]|uniref:GPI mannosyltransferase 2 n=1 Tax=Encephalitozoon intestinalis (strain ATCC 50506) TaxID=876142 RepID=E0S8X4_ENCIT|nr:putative integral membrane protein [Encephalitozoon intestinalis ATCC 50506]ADM12240.1 putative integral membrane protein [Encephalitozoon intestinalis ATCC 50506]UTX46049.1 putative integral membrane protein [Encephalitozoon intestinalis]